MSVEHASSLDSRIEGALDELQAIIQRSYPTASFEVAHGDDPEGIYLKAIVDAEDRDEVVDVFIDRMLEMQIEEELPIYVIPVRPRERVLEQLRVEAATRPHWVRRPSPRVEWEGELPPPFPR